jgi:tetratricopeptide (TPR) repeat protein
MLKPRRQVSKRQELREDTVVTWYARVLQFYDRYRQQLIYGGMAVILLVLGFIGYRAYLSSQNAEAQERLGQIVGVYEQGNFQQALEGTSEAAGLLEIIDEYGATATGNLARFYAADAFYNLGEYERSIELFQAYDKDNDYLGASAYAGLGASYASLEQYENAAAAYERAAEIYQNRGTTPLYLQDAAVNYEEAGQTEKARSLYQRIEDEYPDSPQAEQVEVHLARLEARAGD